MDAMLTRDNIRLTLEGARAILAAAEKKARGNRQTETADGNPGEVMRMPEFTLG